jgi:hypothetical protein
VGVGNNEESFALMGRSHVLRGNSTPVCIVPALGKIGQHFSQATSPQSWHVFDDDPLGFELIDYPVHFRPQPSIVFVSVATASVTDRLTREPNAQAVYGWYGVCSYIFDVVQEYSIRPVRFQRSVQIRVQFDLEHCLAQACSFKS